MDKSLWPLSPGSEPPNKLEHSDFDVEVLADVALDSNERKIVQFLFQ